MRVRERVVTKLAAFIYLAEGALALLRNKLVLVHCDGGTTGGLKEAERRKARGAKEPSETRTRKKKKRVPGEAGRQGGQRKLGRPQKATRTRSGHGTELSATLVLAPRLLDCEIFSPLLRAPQKRGFSFPFQSFSLLFLSPKYFGQASGRNFRSDSGAKAPAVPRRAFRGSGSRRSLGRLPGDGG
jgi:hypothetical protein